MQLTKFKNKLGKLRVATYQRYLEYEDGTPFLYLGDTAGEFFHRLDREEAQYYLSNRAAKGFTVIRAVGLAELGGTDIPNPYGELPLIDRDPATPNEDFFRHVDEAAEELGLFIGMLPTWGSCWKGLMLIKHAVWCNLTTRCSIATLKRIYSPIARNMGLPYWFADRWLWGCYRAIILLIQYLPIRFEPGGTRMKDRKPCSNGELRKSKNISKWLSRVKRWLRMRCVILSRTLSYQP